MKVEHEIDCPSPYDYCTCGAPGSLEGRASDYERGKREGIAEAESRYEQSHGSAYDAGIAEGRKLERETVRNIASRIFKAAREGYYFNNPDLPKSIDALRDHLNEIERGEHAAEGGE